MHGNWIKTNLRLAKLTGSTSRQDDAWGKGGSVEPRLQIKRLVYALMFSVWTLRLVQSPGRCIKHTNHWHMPGRFKVLKLGEEMIAYFFRANKGTYRRRR
jgi:hypothetical protein